MIRSRIFQLAAALSLTALSSSPLLAARGSADFTRLVAIGDSYGAGLESGSVNDRHQIYSWPAVIAKQTGKTICTATAAATDPCYAVPLISYPGIGPDLVLTGLQITGSGGIVPVLTTQSGLGSPEMLTFGRPFNNLSVPGERVVDVDVLTGKETNNPLPSANFTPFILRGQTELNSALALNPTFITIWIGGNDGLLSALNGTAALVTPPAAFAAAYNAMLDKLIAGAPNAGMVVGNLPTPDDALLLPNFNVLQPYVSDQTGTPIVINGSKVPLFGVRGDGTIGALSSDTKILLGAQSDLAQGYGIPPTLAAVPPFSALPHAGQPLPDKDSLTPDEVATLKATVSAYNATIASAAASHNVPVADIQGLFHRVMTGQEFVGPFNITGAFLTGGFFSFDGFHLTDIGYTLFANEYIKTIDSAYNAHVPLAPISQFLSNNGAFFPGTGAGAMLLPGMPYAVSAEAAKQIQQTFEVTAQEPAPTGPRHRGIHN